MRLLLLLTISLIIVSLAGCGPEVAPTHFDVEIAEFKIPEGWVTSEGEGNTVVMLTREEEVDSISSIISIEIMTAPPNSTFLDSANAFAGRYQGTIQPEGTTVDGEKAIQIKIPKGNSLAPTDCIVVHRGEKVCFINGGSVGATAIRPTIDKIVETWKWDAE